MSKENYDLLGVALEARYHGDETPFYYQGDNDGEVERIDFPIERYLRQSLDDYNACEKKMIGLAYGNILDVGCGTGAYIPLLEKNGKVVGIDFSEGMIRVSKLLGIDNCHVQDLFEFEPEEQYDTITLFSTNIGMTGSVEGTRKMLRKMAELLKEDGQILCAACIAGEPYGIMEIQAVWGDKTGLPFPWIHFGKDFLNDLCLEAGMQLEINETFGEEEEDLIRITKINQ